MERKSRGKQEGHNKQDGWGGAGAETAGDREEKRGTGGVVDEVQEQEQMQEKK